MIKKYFYFLFGLISFFPTNVMADEPEIPDAETIAYYRDLLSKNITKVRTSCADIKKELDILFGLTTVTAISSGIGTATAGGALAAGLVKSNYDYKLDAETLEKSPKVFGENWDKLHDDMIASMQKKSHNLGNLRTGLMAGSFATSTVSTGTSIASSVNAKKLGEKMEQCNKAINTLKYSIADIKAQDFPSNTIDTTTADNITSNCTGFDTENIKTLRNTMTTSAVASGVGVATGMAGVITSALANNHNIKDNDKTKKLNVASNVLAGITTGTSATSTIFSANAISKAKKDSEMAEKCENSL